MAVVIGRRFGLAFLLALLAGLLVTTAPATAATITVDTTSDAIANGDGCSLREAIQAANANVAVNECQAGDTGLDTLAFDIPGPSPHVLAPGSPLPNVTDPILIDGLTEPGVSDGLCPVPGGPLAVQVDGTNAGPSKGFFLAIGSDGSTVRGLSVTNFSTHGIDAASSNATITCNYLGVEADGSDDGSNGNLIGLGLTGGPNATIGGPNFGDGNVITHNSIGLEIVSLGGGDHRVQGNTIRDNRDDGIRISAATGIVITQNSIINNGSETTHLGIDIFPDGANVNDAGDGDTGPNNLQNFPVLTSATTDGSTTTVVGTLPSTTDAYTVEFFSSPACDASGHGEGEIYLGSISVTIDGGNPTGAFTATGLNPTTNGRRVTATATNSDGNTSEFSACVTLVEGPQDGPALTVTTSVDTDDGVCGTDHCTLREAIHRANALPGANTIQFNIPGGGVHVISVTGSSLPSITGPVTIDGLTQGPIGCPLPSGSLTVQIDGSAITGFGPVSVGLGLHPGSDGSSISGISITNFDTALDIAVSNVSITCNYVGVEADGSDNGTNGNAVAGVVLATSGTSNNVVGGLNAGEGNLIAHNRFGLMVANGAGNNRILGNVIRDSVLDGVSIANTSVGNLVSQNSVFNNGSGGTPANHLGIDLGADGVTPNDASDADAGPNNLQNFPVLARAGTNGTNTTVVGTLDSVSGTYAVELFSNPACDASGYGEGQTYLGSTSVTIDGSNPTGAFSISTLPNVAVGQVITATASRTTPPLDTSEFSACRVVTVGPGVTVVESSGATAVTEGGATDTVSVVLDAPPAADVAIAFTTGSQLQPIASITFTTTNWNTPQTVAVGALDDALAEGPHNATLTMTATSTDAGYHGIVIPNVAVSITDNDVTGLSIGDTTAAEGDAGTSTLTFTVILTPPSVSVVTVPYATANGTAAGGAACTAGVDYLTTSGTLTFQPQDTQKTVAVTVCADLLAESSESLTVNLGTPTNATLADGQGVGTIADDDVAGAVSFSSGAVQVAENAGQVTLTIQRSGVGLTGAVTPVPGGSIRPDAGPGSAPIHPNAISAVTVSYTTANGTASAGQDYTPVAGTLTFGVGETAPKTVTVPILPDSQVEGNETFTVTLSGPSGGAALGQPATVTVTIVDATPLPPSPPGDDNTDRSRQNTRDDRDVTLTEEQRQQRERTNRSGRDDIATEGNVLETRCDAAWPSVVIANRDGKVAVRLVGEAQAACRSIQPGDYLEVDGEKQHEQLFDADGVTIWRGGERVRP